LKAGNLLYLILLLKRTFTFLNKHYYIIIIISTIAKYTNNKFYKSIAWLIKLFIFANIIFGVGYILYFSLSESSFINGVSIYNDFIKYYLDSLLKFWNDLINIDIENTLIKNTSSLQKEDINVQIKEGIKEALKEVIDEALDKMHEAETNNNNLIKNIAFTSGVLFLSYFIFILPGPNINPEELIQYNWFNQSLIEFKINIFNLFGNNGGSGNTGDTSIIESTISESTIRPNSPSPLTTEASTQTVIDGLTVSRMIESMSIVERTIPEDAFSMITEHSTNIIKDLIE